MGVMSSILGTPVENDATVTAHYGGHSLETSSILDVSDGSITPTSNINWKVDTPALIDAPRTASLAEADAAEKQVKEYEQDVANGLRLLRASMKAQQLTAKLVKGHRIYLTGTARSHLEIAKSNKDTATALHGMRGDWAELGFGLDRSNQQATDEVDLIARKYRG